MRLVLRAALALPLALLASAQARAAETITYTYDARGRLVKVEHANLPSGVNNGLTTTYSHDKADNRTNKTTTGSPN
jgi:YD repeat-containing protein